MIEGFTFTVGGTTYQKRPGSTLTFALILGPRGSLYFDYQEGGLESWEAKDGEEIVDTFDPAGDMSLITRARLRCAIELEWERHVAGVGSKDTWCRKALLRAFEPVPEDDKP